MAVSKFDHRASPEFGALIKKFPKLKHQPHVQVTELHEVVTLMEAMPALTYPINSAGELLDVLGPGKTVKVVGLQVDPARMIKYMPAYYFPIVSAENFVEKMAELIRANRQTLGREEGVANLRKKLPSLPFPIKSAEELSKHVAHIEKFPLGDHQVSANDAVKMLPSSFFPIRDQADFERKALHFVNSRPLIAPE